LALADSLSGRTTNAAVALRVFSVEIQRVQKRDILDYMNIKDMSLGTLDPLHVYVKHDVELKRRFALQKATAPSTLLA